MPRAPPCYTHIYMHTYDYVGHHALPPATPYHPYHPSQPCDSTTPHYSVHLSLPHNPLQPHNLTTSQPHPPDHLTPHPTPTPQLLYHALPPARRRNSLGGRNPLTGAASDTGPWEEGGLSQGLGSPTTKPRTALARRVGGRVELPPLLLNRRPGCGVRL